MLSNASLLEHFVCGGLGGISTVIVGHPLDTIKVRLQTMPPPRAGFKPAYKGTWDCATKIVGKEGLRGLYRGISAPLMGVAPIFAMSFMGYGLGKEIFGHSEDGESCASGGRCFLAGAFSAVLTSTVMTPGERIKCLLQTQEQFRGKKMYSGVLDCVFKLYRQGGVASVYRGFYATLLRDVPASGMYFFIYEWFRSSLLVNANRADISIAATVFAGGAAGIVNWLVSMPIDVVKTRLQSAPDGTYPNGLRDVVYTVLKKEGPVVFYRGTVPVILRSFPANAACFLVIEFCTKCKCF